MGIGEGRKKDRSGNAECSEMNGYSSKCSHLREARGDNSASHPGWFFAKSAESIENKRVEFLASAKKCKRAQKSAQEFDRKGDRG